MLHEKWSLILLFSFLFVAFTNGLLASFTTLYYRKKSIGRLTHSQLRIKQGNANLEHRLNVFAQSFVFCFVTFRIYLITLLMWLALNGAFYIATILRG
jgi:hypothetical protein